MVVAEWIVRLVGLYAAAGVVVGVPFVVWGAPRVDHAAKGAPAMFRVLILPGVAALWPLMLRRWIAAARGRP